MINLIAQVVAPTLDLPAWTLFIPPMLGSAGICLYQHKSGDKFTRTMGKMIIGVGIGYAVGPLMGNKLGLDRFGGAFVASICSPVIVKRLEEFSGGIFVQRKDKKK